MRLHPDFDTAIEKALVGGKTKWLRNNLQSPSSFKSPLFHQEGAFALTRVYDQPLPLLMREPDRVILSDQALTVLLEGGISRLISRHL